MEKVFMGMWPAGKGAGWVRTGALLDELDACRCAAILVEQKKDVLQNKDLNYYFLIFYFTIAILKTLFFAEIDPTK